MAKNRLQIQQEGDSIALFWQRGNETNRTSLFPFEHSVNAQMREDLRWYLEEYLSYPYGNAIEEKALQVERQLQAWGEQLFELVFCSSDKAQILFHKATSAGLDQCELAISSDNSTVLNLPWELLYSPSDGYLSSLLAGMSRRLSSPPVRAEMGALPQDQLNILLVISRPYRERDVALRTIARPLLAALEPIRAQVNLKVLRPPSFAQLERELNTNKGFYHIVHFDGHGGFALQSQGRQERFDSLGQGGLVFEHEDGTPQGITAAQIAQSLSECRVPIFVLNACQSIPGEENQFSSVAMRLLGAGVKGVAVMAYPLYAEASQQFMGQFYEQLVQGASLSSALAAGRRSLVKKKQRPSPKGLLPLQDWLIPVLYQESYTPFPKGVQPTRFKDFLDQAEGRNPSQPAVPKTVYVVPNAGNYGFVGRDYERLRLERGLRQNPIALLHGRGGVGKTELAKGFARWLWETDERTGGIFFTSFKSGATLDNVVLQIGRALGSDRFSQLLPEQQHAVVQQYLQANPCLLIWDNFESVAGFPAGKPPLLAPEEREALKQWLQGLRQGKTWVLIVSRKEEPWLECDYRREPLSGLSPQSAQELAAKIFQSVGIHRETLPPAYLELLPLLGRHPLSLQVVLPHLRHQSPTALIEAIRQRIDCWRGEEERSESGLSISLDYAFAQLSEGARQYLPLLSLFCERVDADWLSLLSQNLKQAFGEKLKKSDWIALLNEAVAAGILQCWSGTIYHIHPTLPVYLRQKLIQQYSDATIKALEAQLLIFYASLADYYREKLVSEANNATAFFRIEEPNLLEQLRLAQQQQVWSEAQYILQALGEVYKSIGHKEEFRILRRRALGMLALNVRTAKTKGQDAVDFWRYLKVADANEALQATKLDEAKAVYQEILEVLMVLEESSAPKSLAFVYYQLGNVAQEQRQYPEAIIYYRRALAIFQQTQDRYWSSLVTSRLVMVLGDKGWGIGNGV